MSGWWSCWSRRRLSSQPGEDGVVVWGFVGKGGVIEEVAVEDAVEVGGGEGAFCLVDELAAIDALADEVEVAFQSGDIPSFAGPRDVECLA